MKPHNFDDLIEHEYYFYIVVTAMYVIGCSSVFFRMQTYVPLYNSGVKLHNVYWLSDMFSRIFCPLIVSFLFHKVDDTHIIAFGAITSSLATLIVLILPIFGGTFLLYLSGLLTSSSSAVLWTMASLVIMEETGASHTPKGNHDHFPIAWGLLLTAIATGVVGCTVIFDIFLNMGSKDYNGLCVGTSCY
jgi:hypothetical protein